jgi:hypothetical protein
MHIETTAVHSRSRVAASTKPPVVTRTSGRAWSGRRLAGATRTGRGGSVTELERLMEGVWDRCLGARRLVLLCAFSLMTQRSDAGTANRRPPPAHRIRSLSVVLLALGSEAQLGAQISAHGVGPFRLCDTLARVSSLFPSARDTTRPDSEVSLPVWSGAEPSLSGIAKVVRLPDGKWILFETAFPDSIHVWRVRTNSPAYGTARGYRVGMSASDLFKSGAQLEVLAPIGVLYLTADSVTFLVDNRSAHDFWEHSDAGKSASAGMNLLKRNARIKELLIASDCEPQ